MNRVQRRRFAQATAFALLAFATFLILAIMVGIISFVASQGIGAISWEFLTAFPRSGMTEGGIFPAIVGTFYLAMGTTLISLPLGVFAAIYLVEYSYQGRLIRLIRIGINNLAGVPSIVFGLFGLALFVRHLGLGVSLLSGSLTLAFFVLPLVIRASEEALLAVPQGFREGALALGATKWQSVYTVVLPTAVPAILTGGILALGIAAGQTAPIIFTAAAFFTPRLPDSIFSPIMALPFHIYVMASESAHFAVTRHLQFGTALVLLAIVFGINITAIIIRSQMRKRRRW
ncbi:TPA: phosphate ABC transporter permease PtsA [Candidatus Acetothermia bacterium]|nr:phosphate ABC transporter permease PtsA [Candidatus Acetothermia bacterium]